MASTILLPKNVDLTKITFGAPKLLNGGARVVPISYAGKQFIFQTARMVCNYGLSKWGEGASAKYSVDGSFKGKENNKSLENFFEFLMKLDKFMVEKGVENSVEWLKKKHNNNEVVQALYTHTVKFPKDKETGEITDKYPPSFKMNVPFKDGKCTCSVYDSKQQVMELLENATSALKGATISAIIKCTGVWLAGGNYGLTFRIEQLRVEATSTGINGFAFQDDEDTICDAEAEDNEDDIDDAPVKSSCAVDTSDEDDHDIPADTPPVASDPVASSTNDEEENDGIDPPPKTKAAPKARKPASKA